MSNKVSKSIITAEKTTIKAIVILIILALLTAYAGNITEVVILTATALNIFTDILALFACYLGLRLSRKKASKEFSFGFYKIETFAALIVALFTCYLATNVFSQSWDRFLGEPTVKYPYIGFIVAFLIVVSSLYLFKTLSKAAKETNSLALKTSAEDKRNDLLNAAVIIFGIIASYYHVHYFEGLFGMFYSLVIFKHGLYSAKESLFFLLDYFDDPILIKKIRNLIDKNSRIVNHIKKIRLRRAGTFIFGEIYVEINPFAVMQDLRVELDLLKNKIIKMEPFIKDLIIYTLLPKPPQLRIGISIKEDHGLKSIISKNFQETKYYLIVTVKDNKIKNWEVKDFSFKKDEFNKIINFYLKHKLNVIVDNDMHSLTYFELLAKSYINIFPHFSNVQEAEGIIKILMINN